MAKFKIWMVALTALMGISLTSCFDSDDNGDRTGFAYGKCINFFPPTFQLITGEKLVLSGTSKTFNEGEIYGFYYQYNINQLEEGASSTTVSVYSGTEPFSVSAKGNEGPIEHSISSEGNAPFYTLTGTIPMQNTYMEVKPALAFDNEYLMATAVYWAKQEVKPEDQEKEFDKHSFVITYDLENVKPGDDELVLTYNHVITETGEETVERKSFTYTTKAYNLSSVMYEFAAIAGSKPTKIKVVAKTNSNKNSFDGAVEQVWEHTIK